MIKDNTNVDIQKVFTQLKDKIALQSDVDAQAYIPDIIEFCNSSKYLDLPAHGINLFPVQKIILKVFYRGQKGNEHIKLTQDELKLLKKHKQEDVIKKYYSDELFRELILVLGRRCVSENTTIINPVTGKEQQVGEMWDNGQKDNIVSWTFDEKNSKMKTISNCNLIYQGIRPVYKLQTFSGHEIEVTANHPFMTQRGWVKLEELDIGKDKVAIVESIPFFGTSNAISEDEASILGYMTGDGNCSQSSTFFTCANSEVLEDFKEKINSISDNLTVFHDPWTGAKSQEYQYKIRSKERIQETYYNHKMQRIMSKFSKSDLQKLLAKHDLLRKTCHHKIAPKILLECPKNIIANYLRALYSCDGCIYKDKNRITISFCTVNENQAKRIQGLLARFSIVARLRTRHQKTTIKRENRSYHNTSFEVSFAKSIYIQRFLDNIGFIGKIIPPILAKSKPSNNLSYCNIRDIKYVGEKRTFDIQVSNHPNEQNFVANGFLVHNSGKDFLVSIMALYETMKLLEIPGGCPFSYYNLAPGNPIYIVTIATSSEQAGILFTEMKTKMQQSPYFRNKIGRTGADKVWLLTPKDRANNEELMEKDMSGACTRGSIVIMSGHSNSDSLLGKGFWAILFDEVAAFKSTAGSSGSGERLYEALGPGTVAFNKPVLDENGNFIMDEFGLPKKTLDSKIISLSSPRGEEGIFYRLYKETPNTENRLAFRLPTWKVNEAITESLLRHQNKYMSPAAFAMEFGAEFASTAGEKYIPDQYVDKALELGANLKLSQRLEGRPGQIYYAHLDPAATSHNYALVVLHIEDRIRVIDKNGMSVKERFKLFVVDHIKSWQPPVSSAISVKEVDEYIIDLARRFRFGMVTYDSWNSLSSIQKLRSKGIPTKMTPFRKAYKVAIYTQLEDLLTNRQLALPRRGEFAEQMEQELKCLKRIYTPVGFKIQPDPEGNVITDDLVDALSGAIGTASERAFAGYPKGGTVLMPQSRGSETQWNIGRGSYGNQQWRHLNKKFGKFNPYGG
ncbi:hypothetical protein LCGC14_1512560 [marine sediment metagenome]|uniref:DOD-type homing endonuclease domain-containing protein n=1 Tax=marine sediment metagenome TaxID=412755 RepID=A0A0F9M260_9ZZZZ